MQIRDQPLFQRAALAWRAISFLRFDEIFFIRAADAFCAISLLRLAESFAARALPPFEAPKAARATAAGFFFLVSLDICDERVPAVVAERSRSNKLNYEPAPRPQKSPWFRYKTVVFAPRRILLFQNGAHIRVGSNLFYHRSPDWR